MQKRATASEVAILAGVSKWTVNRAFTPGASIAEASRAKVLKAAQSLNYTPNLLARGLATRSTRQVAVFVDDFANPHKLPFLEQLTATLQEEGLVAILININRNFDHVRALINSGQRQVDAVVLCGTAFRDETLRDKSQGPGMPPLFVIARDSQIDGVPAINCDTEYAMAEMCDYFAQRGYQRPAFMTGPRTLSTALGRHRCFAEFWRSRGLPPILELNAPRYTAEDGAAAIRRHLSSCERRIDLLMCENDTLACGARDVIGGEFGLSVPGDIALAGFDNISLAAAPCYDLTTYQQPTEEMIRVMVDMILGRRAPASVNLRGRFVPRTSA